MRGFCSLMGHLAASMALLLVAGSLGAQQPPQQGASGLVRPESMPGPLNEVSFEQQLGENLPLDVEFLDEDGHAVRLGSFFEERPVVLAFVYYECPMLCSLVLNGLAKAVGVLTLDVGKEFDVVVISFDSEETPELAAQSKATVVKRYGRPGTEEGWHFLTGSEAAIQRVTQATGFQYELLPDGEYAHASGIMITTPQGLLSQYFYGIEYPPKDLRLALIDSAEERIGSLVDQILLYCYRYDPQLGQYTALTMRIVRVAGVAFSLLLASFLLVMWRREKNLKNRPSPKLGAV